MTELSKYLATTGKNPVEAMNELQEHGVISDNCVDVEDVADTDRAILFFKMREFTKDLE